MRIAFRRIRSFQTLYNLSCRPTSYFNTTYM